MLRIVDFTDFICSTLKPWNYSHGRREERAVSTSPVDDQVDPLSGLVWITDNDGRRAREPTVAQIRSGKLTGNAITAQCFICRKYLDKDGAKPHTPDQFFAIGTNRSAVPAQTRSVMAGIR